MLRSVKAAGIVAEKRKLFRQPANFSRSDNHEYFYTFADCGPYVRSPEMPISEVGWADLENNGAIFYMNGKNGTAFDWYVNEYLPCFFIYYNDDDNLGTVKATLYADGNMSVYVYG